MSIRHFRAILIALTTLAFAAPAAANDDCDDALAQLQAALGASPGTLSQEAAAALAGAVAACGASAPESVTDRLPIVATPFTCGAGTVQGVGLMQVIISIPPLQSVWYDEVAVQSYTLDSSGNEEFKSRGGSSVGFDAVTLVGGSTFGTVYVAAQSFPATSAGASGTCSHNNGIPCAGSGHAELIGAALEVYLIGNLGAACNGHSLHGPGAKGYVGT